MARSTKHTRDCDYCGKTYTGLGEKYCSNKCVGLAKTAEPVTTDPGSDSYMRIKEENLDLRRQLKQRAKSGVMFEVLAEQIRGRTPILPVRKPPKIGSGEIEEDLVCVFSDAHADQIIKPERVLGFEDYGWVEFCRRFERWIDSIRDWSQENLSHHRFPRLWLFCLGDNIQGDQHGATKHTTWGNTMKAALAVGDVLGQGIQDLADIFPEIVVVGISGNHPRWANKISWTGAHENFDYLTYVQASSWLRGYQDRITFHVPDSYQAVCNVRGFNFLLSHGHEVRSWSGVPWYGLERRGRRTQAIFAAADEKLHYHCIGHFHTAGSLQTPAGELVINGNWSYTDEYALDALGAASKPMQWMFGVHESYGMTWRLPIHVAHTEDVPAVPRYDQRTMVDLAEVDRQAKHGVPVIRAS